MLPSQSRAERQGCALAFVCGLVGAAMGAWFFVQRLHAQFEAARAVEPNVAMCGNEALGAMLVGTLVGGFVGTLVGAFFGLILFPKRPPPEPDA